jgi:hypothetical protein
VTRWTCILACVRTCVRKILKAEMNYNAVFSGILVYYSIVSYFGVVALGSVAAEVTLMTNGEVFPHGAHLRDQKVGFIPPGSPCLYPFCLGKLRLIGPLLHKSTLSVAPLNRIRTNVVSVFGDIWEPKVSRYCG